MNQRTSDLAIDICTCGDIGPSPFQPIRSNGEILSSDWFDPRPYLGERGYKYHTAAARMLSAAMTRMESALPEPEDFDSTGVAIGTNFGNVDVLADFARTIATSGAETLQPMEAPNFSINVAASLLSIRHGFRAFNITLTEDTRAGLDALVEAVRAIAAKRAVCVIAGAVEPTLPACVLQDSGLEPSSHLGAALFTLKPAGAGRATAAQILRTRRARITEPSTAYQRFMQPLLEDLPKPVSIILCYPPSVHDRVGEFKSINQTKQPQAEWRMVPVLSCIASLRELWALTETAGIHLLLCWDQYQAVTGVVINIPATNRLNAGKGFDESPHGN